MTLCDPIWHVTLRSSEVTHLLSLSVATMVDTTVMATVAVDALLDVLYYDH